MVISNLTNEELITVVFSADSSTEIEKELCKRLAEYEDNSNLLERVEEAKEELNHKKNMFIVCASSIFLKEELPEHFYYMPDSEVKNHIKEHLYGDYKNFTPEYIWEQLNKLAKRFVKDLP